MKQDKACSLFKNYNKIHGNLPYEKKTMDFVLLSIVMHERENANT